MIQSEISSIASPEHRRTAYLSSEHRFLNNLHLQSTNCNISHFVDRWRQEACLLGTEDFIGGFMILWVTPTHKKCIENKFPLYSIFTKELMCPYWVRFWVKVSRLRLNDVKTNPKQNPSIKLIYTNSSCSTFVGVLMDCLINSLWVFSKEASECESRGEFTETPNRTLPPNASLNAVKKKRKQHKKPNTRCNTCLFNRNGFLHPSH